MPPTRECESGGAPALGERALSSAPLQSPALTFPVLCPLCFGDCVVEPVLLHPHPAASGGCVACQTCAAVWAPLVSHTAGVAGASALCPCCDQPMDPHTPAAEAGGTVFPLVRDLTAPPRSLMNKCVSGSPSTPLDVAEVLSAWRREGGGGARVPPQASTHTTPAVLCGACEGVEATLMCLQCDCPLCEGCRADTHARGRYRQHEVLPIGEARARLAGGASAAKMGGTAASGGAPPRTCATHPAQSLDLYCRECESCICVSCCFGGAHAGHDVAPLATTAEDARAGVRGMARDAASTAAGAAATRAELTTLAPAYDALVVATETRLSDVFARLRAALTKREEVLREGLRAASAGVRAGLQAQATLTESVDAAMRHCERSLNALAQVESRVTLMETLPAAQRAYAALHTLGSHLSIHAARAQARLVARVARPSAEDGEGGSGGPLLSFALFSDERGDGDGDAAVTEYARLLGSLGEVRAQTCYPTAEDAHSPWTRARSPGAGPVKVDEVPTEAPMGLPADQVSHMSGEGRPAKVVADDDGVLGQERDATHTMSDGTSPASGTTRRWCPSGRSARPPAGPTAEVPARARGESSSTASPTVTCLATRSASGRSEGVTVTSLVGELGARRTEAHQLLSSRPAQVIGGLEKSASAGLAARGEWLAFGTGAAAGPLAPLSTNSAAPVPCTGKLVLDLTVDGRGANLSNGSGLARFSNCSVGGPGRGRGEEPLLPLREPSSLGWCEPPLKASRWESASESLGAYAAPAPNTSSSAAVGEGEQEVPLSSNGPSLQLRL